MSLLASLRYLTARLRHRDVPAAFLRTGLGIEIRARKLATHWRPHQDRSRQAQSRWPAHGRRLAVLGPGRLLDFEHSLAQRFEHLRFIDADPLCQPFWKRRHPCHEPVIANVAATLKLPARMSWSETLTAIAAQRAGHVDAPWLRNCDAVLSLNLLSQIPIAWQDRVEVHLRRQFGAAFLQAHEEEWLTAVGPGARSLVESHLAMLDQCGSRDVLLITDLAYIEYRGSRTYSRRRWEPPPDLHGAEAEDALYGLGTPALPNYVQTEADQWQWHISPQGLERRSSGWVHAVGSFAFRKTDSR